MRATIDLYLEMRISLDMSDFKELEEHSQVKGKIKIKGNGEKPLTMYIKDSWRATPIPSSKPLDQVDTYEVDIPYEEFLRVKNMEIISARYPEIDIRRIYVKGAS